ncbi:MAG TPA: hypothetical protein VFY42_08620, partial [Gemmatimonadales bacterium]|nr:hypothetical protein [Gemmatimonadales bacterium]
VPVRSLALPFEPFMLFLATLALGISACTSEQIPTEPSAGARPALAAAAKTYTAVDLGVLGGPFGLSSLALDFNAAGQVVGSSTFGSGFHAFLWDKGVMTDLGTLGGNLSAASGINSRGQVVGGSLILPTNAEHAFLWENGVMTDLGTLGGRESRATDINPAGVVVGFSEIAEGISAPHAFLWEKGVMTDLSVGEPTGAEPQGRSVAAAINPRGQVVGLMSTAQGTHAFVWTKGSVTDLGTLGGCCSEAYDINPAGQVVGTSYVPGNEEHHAFLWDKGVMTDLGSPGVNSDATGINSKGQIVGQSGFRAFFWEKGVMTELISLDRRFDSRAEAINAAGQIVGYSNTERGGRATLWTRK